MLTITNHGNGSYSYYSEEKKANRNIPSELGKAILEERKEWLNALSEMRENLDKLSQLNTPAKAFVEKVNQEIPGTFRNLDSGANFTDYSDSEGGEIVNG